MPPLSDRLPARHDATSVRLLREADLEAFHAYRSDESLARFQGWSPMTREAARTFLLEMALVTSLIPGDWVQLGIAQVEGDLLLGDLGLFLSEDQTWGEIGFTLSKGAQGRGHATRAVLSAVGLFFDVNPSIEIRAVTDALNERSARVLERAGFRQVAVQRGNFKGQPCTELLYALRRSDASSAFQEITARSHRPRLPKSQRLRKSDERGFF